MRDKLEIAQDDFLGGGGSGFEAPEVHSQGQRDLGNPRGVIVGGEGQGLQNVGGCAEGLQAAHDGGGDACGAPLETGGRQRGAVRVVDEIVFHGTEGSVSGGWVEGEVGVAAVAGVVPAGEFDVDFVLGVDANAGPGAIVEKAEDSGWIHFVDGTFHLPLVRAETEIFRGEKFGGGVRSFLINDAQMQIAFCINGNVCGITFGNTGHAAARKNPSAAHPLKRVRGGRCFGRGEMDADWNCSDSEQNNEQTEFWYAAHREFLYHNGRQGTVSCIKLERPRHGRARIPGEESKMPAYIVFRRLHTRNRTELDLYAKEVATFVAGYNVKFLSRFGPCEVTEGPGVEGLAILEFPTMTEAKAWYNSPVSEEAAKHRHLGGDYGVVFTEGVEATASHQRTKIEPSRGTSPDIGKTDIGKT